MVVPRVPGGLGETPFERRCSDHTGQEGVDELHPCIVVSHRRVDDFVGSDLPQNRNVAGDNHGAAGKRLDNGEPESLGLARHEHDRSTSIQARQRPSLEVTRRRLEDGICDSQLRDLRALCLSEVRSLLDETKVRPLCAQSRE